MKVIWTCLTAVKPACLPSLCVVSESAEREAWRVWVIGKERGNSLVICRSTATPPARYKQLSRGPYSLVVRVSTEVTFWHSAEYGSDFRLNSGEIPRNSAEFRGISSELSRNHFRSQKIPRNSVSAEFRGHPTCSAVSLMIILIVQRTYLSIVPFAASVFESWYRYGAFRIPDAKLSLPPLFSRYYFSHL